MSDSTNDVTTAIASALAVASLVAGLGCGGASLKPVPCPESQTRCGADCVDEGTDPRNCGGCGLACDQCTNGHCVRVLAAAQAFPGAIAVTSTEVVWVNQGVAAAADGGRAGAAIAKVPIGGGTIETLALSQRMPTSLAIDSGHAYWTMTSSISSVQTEGVPDGTVMKVPLQGGSPTVVAAQQIEPWRIAVHAGTVYWSAREGVMSAPTSGGAPTVVAPGNTIRALIVSAGTAYWAETPPTAEVAFKKKELAADTPTITLYEGSLQFGSVLDLAVSSTDLYWTVIRERGSVQKVALSGGVPTTVYTADDDDLDLAIAIDGNNLYWGNKQLVFDERGEAGRILKAPLAGGAPVTLSPAALETRFIVVDATSVYFTDDRRGDVVKVTPK